MVGTGQALSRLITPAPCFRNSTCFSYCCCTKKKNVGQYEAIKQSAWVYPALARKSWVYAPGNPDRARRFSGARGVGGADLSSDGRKGAEGRSHWSAFRSASVGGEAFCSKKHVYHELLGFGLQSYRT